jgi:phosphatidylinositol alpha-1,6-mannosyltransferase
VTERSGSSYGPRGGGAGSADAEGARPRLLLLTPDYPPVIGGVQLLMSRIASGVQGFDMRVLTPDSDGAARFDATSGVGTRRVRPLARSARGRIVGLNALALTEALRFRPELVLSGHIVTSPAAALIRRAVGARTVQYFHAREIGGRPRLAAFAARQAHARIAISTYTAGLLVPLGVSRETVTVIPPGVDLPADPRPEVAGRPTVLTIARLADSYKGHDVLLRSLASVRERVPDVEWVVIGDGPLRPGLEALARARGLGDSARFLGSVSDRERDLWLRRADLLAMPSRLPDGGRPGEGYGIVYLEAGAHGKPVVAGNVGGPLDAVLDGETGLLVEPTDAAAVAEAITTLLLDEKLAHRLGSAGAERARGLAWPAIVERVQAVLDEQLAAVRGTPRADPEASGARR